MAKITLTTVTNGQDISNINANFSALASALNLNVLYRKNIAGEDNTMQNDLDFNGYRAYNLADVLVNGISVTTVATNAQNAANSASASAGAALASQVASASSQAAAAQSAIDAANAAGAAGSLIAVNNLSDVPNKVTARFNLGLDQVNNTSDAAKPVSTATQTALNLKADLISPSFTSPNTGTTPPANDASGAIPNTLWVNGYFLKQTDAASTYATITNLGLKANTNSPTLTGVPLSVTPASSDNSTKIATTAFVQSNFAAPQIPYGSSTPNSVAATTITATGLITPTSSIGIKGTVVGDNAQAGSIGEVAAQSGGGAAGISSGTTTSVGSVTLTPGDWEVQTVINFAATTSTIAGVFAGTGTVLNTFGPLGTYVSISTSANSGQTIVSPMVRYNVTTSTIVYSTGNVSFTGGTCTMQSIIYARRVR